MEVILAVFIWAVAVQLFADIYMIIKIRNSDELIDVLIAMVEDLMNKN